MDNELERMWKWSWSLFEVLSKNLLGGFKDIRDTCLRIAGLRDEVFTRVTTECHVGVYCHLTATSSKW